MEQRRTVETGTQWSDNTDGRLVAAEPGEGLESGEVQYRVKPGLELRLNMLANRLLHGSYWYLLLQIISDSTFGMSERIIKAARRREEASREAARTIITWLREVGSQVRLVDIARPDHGTEEEFCLENALKTLLTLDIWLEQGLVEVMVEADPEMEDMLATILNKLRDFHSESKAMKDQIMLS